MALSDDEMWEAVIQNNKAYDGHFFYAVKTTGIVCRPSCKSKDPKRENVCYFFHLAHAFDQGFRSCKRCCPNLIGPTNEEEVVNNAVKIIEKKYMTHLTLKKLASEVGVSPYHFQRLFKKVKGFTPTIFINDYRLKKSVELLVETDWTMTKIAQEVGYQTSTYFSSCFRKKLSLSPSAFRRQHKGIEEENQ